MTNAVTNTHCPECGASYALVGRVHNCRPRVPVSVTVPNGAGPKELPDSPDGSSGSSTYKYRDPEKWRAYMRDYMRKKRANG